MSLRPDIRMLERLPARGVIVTSRSDNPEFDFASRFFAPCVGVDEDPVCGSAHWCGWRTLPIILSCVVIIR